jgi:hypothetical protein
MVMGLVGVVGVSVLAPSSARAGGVAVESVAGERAKATAAVLAPIFEELSRRGYRSGADVGKAFEKAASRPSKVAGGLGGDFIERIDTAYRLWIGGRFQEGVAAMKPLVQEAYLNPSSLIGTPAFGAAVFKAQVGIAMCHHRLGDDTAAWAAMAELVRSFDVEVTKAQYGAEAYGLYQQVKKEAKAKATGGLSIRSADSTAAIYVNERFARVGELNRADLVPGTYRVIAQLGPDLGRAYDVEVKAGAKTDLVVDPAFERTIVTGVTGAPGDVWTGLHFRDRAEREQRELDVAARFGAALGELGVIAVGIDTRKERTVAYGALINASTGKEIRRASVVIDTMPPPARLQALARFLVGEPTPLDGVEVHKIVARPKPQPAGSVAGAPPPPPDRPLTGKRKLALALGGVGLVGVGVGVVLHYQAYNLQKDADALCEGMPMCSKSDEAGQLSEEAESKFLNALISYGAGSAVLIGAGVLWYLGAPTEPSDESASIAPRLAPGYAGLDVMGRF